MDWGSFSHFQIGRAKRPLMAFVIRFLQGHVEAFNAFGGVQRRSYTGRMAVALNSAIDQLENHRIHYWYPDPAMPNEDGSKGMWEAKFTFIEKVSRVREDRKSTPYYYVFKVPDIILGSIFHDRYFFCMSWARIEKLPPQAYSMARILYRYSKEQSKNFVYKNKDYATICKDWLGGLTPKSRIGLIKQKHLASRLDPIIETRDCCQDTTWCLSEIDLISTGLPVT